MQNAILAQYSQGVSTKHTILDHTVAVRNNTFEKLAFANMLHEVRA